MAPATAAVAGAFAATGAGAGVGERDDDAVMDGVGEKLGVEDVDDTVAPHAYLLRAVM